MKVGQCMRLRVEVVAEVLVSASILTTATHCDLAVNRQLTRSVELLTARRRIHTFDDRVALSQGHMPALDVFICSRLGVSRPLV